MAPVLVEPSADGPASVPRPTAPDPDRDSDPAPPEPTAQSGSFIHGLIGLSPGGFSETVRNSISSLTKRDHDAVTITTQITAQSPPQVGADMALKLEGDNIRPISPPPQKPQPRHLLALPPEMLFMILQRLDFADIVRLRKTCKQLHDLANPQQIRILFGPAQLRMQLLGHCKTCLLYDPFRSRLLQPCMVDPGYPLASRCLDCAVKGHDPRIRVGKKINLANFDTVWVCRWCGYPIVEGAAFGCEQFHRFCYVRYNDLLVGFFVLGWLQLGLGIVAAALAWKYYRNSLLVFAPTVTNFILLWICLGFLVFRGNVLRTYHITLVLELTILGLWIPPVYHIATEIASSSGSDIQRSTQATLAMFALNMLFRLINLVGNAVLLLRFDTTRRSRSSIPAWTRPFHYLATALVMWTYPQSLEQKYPPDYF